MHTSVALIAPPRESAGKLNLPRDSAVSLPPAIEAPHTWTGNTPSSAPVSENRSLATPSSNVVLTLPSYLEWVTSSISKTNTKSLTHSVSDLPTRSTPTPAYGDMEAGVKTSSQAIPADLGDSAGESAWITMKTKSTSMSGTPTSSTPVVSMLWQPPNTNIGRRLGVPKLFVGLLSLFAVVAASLERVEPPAVIFAVASVPVATLTTSSDRSPPPSTISLNCPQGQDQCGHSICYDPKTQWCCPDNLNVCQYSEVCAKAETGHGEAIYGCGPPDARNGTNSRIHTTSVHNLSEDVRTTTTVISTNLSTAIVEALTSSSTSTTASVSQPTGSGGTRLGIPSIMQSMVLLVRSAQAAAFASPVRPECCGDICCNLDEICTRSSTGPKCWPKAEQRAARSKSYGEAGTASMEIALRQTQQNEVAPTDEEAPPASLSESKVVAPVAAVGAGAAAAAGGAGHHKKKGNAARPTAPTLFYVFLLLIPFIAANLSPSLPVANNHVPQTSPSTQATTFKRWLFGKRWSCHKPNQNCGSSGCWDPAVHFCCNQPDGHYGLCAASKGEVCCGKSCCSENTECRNEGDFLCYPKALSISEAEAVADTGEPGQDGVVERRKLGGLSSFAKRRTSLV
jgi:hypothetical protein